MRIAAEPDVALPGSAGPASAIPAAALPAAPAAEPAPRGRFAFTERRRWRLARLVGALFAGGCLALSYPPYGAWPLGFIGAGLLPLVVRGTRTRSAFILATVAGLSYFIPTLAFVKYAGLNAWFGLALLEALILGVAGPAFAAVQRLPLGAVWCPAIWVADEALRGRAPFGGFPWARLAFAQVDEPALRWAAIGGAPLVSFVVAATGCALVAVVIHGTHFTGSTNRARIAAGLVVAALALPGLGPMINVPTGGQADAHGRGSIQIAVVQGNVPRLGLNFDAQRRAVLDNHTAETLRLAAAVKAGTLKQPDIVIWPENSSDIDPFENADGAAELNAAATAIGVPILVGAVLDAGPGKVANAGVVWAPTGPTGVRYVKHHPVPFGEYVPFRSEVSALIPRLNTLIPNDFIKGQGSGALAIGPTTVGDVICFEVAYDGLARNTVRDGARLLAVQTNNATFGFTAESSQQLQMTRLRTVETGRAAVVASTTGISAVIEPDGKVIGQTRIFTRGVLDRSIPLRSSLTVADRIGAWPEWILTILGCAAVVSAAGVAAAGSHRAPGRRSVVQRKKARPRDRGRAFQRSSRS